MKHVQNPPDVAISPSAGNQCNPQKVSAPPAASQDHPRSALTLPDGLPALTDPYENERREHLARLTRVVGEQAMSAGGTGLQVVSTAGTSASDHRSSPRHALSASLLQRHGTRLASFSVIGGLVLILGVAVQAMLIRLHTGTYGSYAGQAIFSIELSYLLNRKFTWHDRSMPLWSSFWRFNVQKLALTVPNALLYSLMAWAGANWLIANLATTAVFTAANYVTGDLWSFAARTARKHAGGADKRSSVYQIPPLPRGTRLPNVSIVIPCKDNRRTIRATVDALLSQDYPALVEVILVGDVADPTWSALTDVNDPRLVCLEQDKTPGQRDPNVKRHKGLAAARGELLALADSDIVMDPDWLSKAVALLTYQGGGLVAGGMRAIHPHKFWPRFVDRNAIAAKTSRLQKPYFVTADNFGSRGHKPPLTANAVFTRDLYWGCPLDASWAYGYEDYEWYWRLARNGYCIQYHGALTAAHHHREKFSQLIREYRRSAEGCAEFIRRHPDSPLAEKRRAQARLLPLVGLAMAMAAGVAIFIGYPLAVAVLPVIALLVLGTREIAKSRAAEAIAYPVVGLALASVFTWSLARNLIRPSERSAVPSWESRAENNQPENNPSGMETA